MIADLAICATTFKMDFSIGRHDLTSMIRYRYFVYGDNKIDY